MSKGKIYNIIIFSFIFLQTIHGANNKNNAFFNCQNDSNYLFSLEGSYSSLVIKTSDNEKFQDAYIKINGEQFFLIKEEHSLSDNFIASQLIIPQSLFDKIEFYSGKLTGEIFIYLFYVEPYPQNNFKKEEESNELCDKPATIGQDEWRFGLPAPTVTPTPTVVEHLIVHHSAGSNTNTNYHDVVRNIYTYHTTPAPAGNGWDDIGYNFLIAQDGTIFQGRDGQGLYEDDNVQGAHFCSKNSKTMGVCILGTYTDIYPSDTTFKSLKKLFTWKCFKESIDPLGSSSHPTSIDPLLDNIAGHRQGCSTECPGDKLFESLASIRNETNNLVSACNIPSSASEAQAQLFQIYQNNENGYIIESGFDINTVCLFDLSGRIIMKTHVGLKNTILSLNNFSKGIYLLTVSNDKNNFSKLISVE